MLYNLISTIIISLNIRCDYSTRKSDTLIKRAWMKTLHIVLAGTLLFTVTGCSSIQKFSEQGTSTLINEITTYTPADTGKAVRAKWVHPSNKDVACKIFESSKNPELILWDGECKSGYAYGLGREMIVVDGKSFSAIGKYSGNKTEPTYYLHSEYDSNQYFFGDLSKGGVITRVTDSLTAGAGAFIMTAAAQPDGVYYRQIVSIGAGTTILRKEFPTEFSVEITKHSNPAHPIVFEAIMYRNKYPMGLAYFRYRNNAVQVFEQTIGEPKLVVRHNSYYQFLGEIEAEIATRTNGAKKNADAALEVVNTYRARACAQNQDEFSSFNYYQNICRKAGELQHFKTVATKVASERDKRFANTRKSLQVKSQKRAQLQAVNAAQQAQELSNMADSLNETGQMIYQSGQSALNSVISNGSFTEPSFGIPETINTYCYETGNIINCQSR